MRKISFEEPSRVYSLRSFFVTGSSVSVLMTALALTATPAAAATPCAGLTAVSIPNTVITSATLVPASGTTPQYCNVMASVAPDTQIQIQLPDNWQHRYLHMGGSGFDGFIPTGVPAANNVNLLAEGYALGASNGGHDGTQYPGASFASNQTLVIDYGYAAIGQTDVAARALIQAYYGHPARYRYFDGCSNGGRGAGVAASRYRADYDGIIAGDGVYGHAHDHVGGSDMAGLTSVWARATDSVNSLNEASPTLGAKLTALYNAQVARCDGLDGMLDGIISNPSACHFDPAALACPKSTSNASCLTPPELAAVKTVMTDLTRNGHVIGAPLGLGDLGGGQTGLGVMGGAGTGLAQGLLSMAYSNPNYTVSSYNLQKDFPFLVEQLEKVEGQSGPLDEVAEYVRDGNKLIVWTGGEDTLVPTADSVRFVGRLLQVVDGHSGDNVRFYTLPGLGHCGVYGPGAATMDLLTPMRDWVEHGIAPKNLVASNVTGTTVNFSRPICNFPFWPKYKGSGPNVASSFVCVPPGDQNEAWAWGGGNNGQN